MVTSVNLYESHWTGSARMGLKSLIQIIGAKRDTSTSTFTQKRRKIELNGKEHCRLSLIPNDVADRHVNGILLKTERKFKESVSESGKPRI